MPGPAGEMQIRFWRGFKPFLVAAKSSLQLPEPKRQPGVDLLPKCAAGIFVTVRISTQPQRLTTDLTFSRDARGEYRRIRNSFRQQIDQSLGIEGPDYDELAWVADPKQSESHVKVFKDIGDPYDETQWAEHYAWLSKNASTLYQWGKR